MKQRGEGSDQSTLRSTGLRHSGKSNTASMHMCAKICSFRAAEKLRIPGQFISVFDRCTGCYIWHLGRPVMTNPWALRAERRWCGSLYPRAPHAFTTFRLHPLKGDLKGFYSLTVRANWRIIFRFDNGKASDVDVVDYH